MATADAPRIRRKGIADPLQIYRTRAGNAKGRMPDRGLTAPIWCCPARSLRARRRPQGDAPRPLVDGVGRAASHRNGLGVRGGLDAQAGSGCGRGAHRPSTLERAAGAEGVLDSLTPKGPKRWRRC